MKKNKEFSEKSQVILFDGVCNLCNGFIQFVIERDPEKKFVFTSLHTEKAKKLLHLYGIELEEVSTIYLLDDTSIHSHSSAILKILKHLKGGWFLFFPFILLPKFLRDKMYSFIAKHRYQWFGKSQVCWIPTPELKERFL